HHPRAAAERRHGAARVARAARGRTALRPHRRHRRRPARIRRHRRRADPRRRRRVLHAGTGLGRTVRETRRMTPAVLRWLVRDVFRQARATGLLAALLTVTAVATLVCLTASFEPVTGRVGVGYGRGTLTVLFGSVTVVAVEPREQAVQFLQFLLA